MSFDSLVGYADKGLTWLLGALGAFVLAQIAKHIGNSYAQGVLSRGWEEIKAAVLEVKQTYVDGIKAGAADGNLTQAEKDKAKADAIAKAKANLGTAGLARLGRIVGLGSLESWISNKVEAAVHMSKSPATAPEASTAPLPSGAPKTQPSAA